MKLVITGATGFVGSHSTAAALAAGHTVRALVRSQTKAEQVLGNLGLTDDIASGRIEIQVGDVTAPAEVADAVSGYDAVIHCAAAIALGRAGAAQAHTTNVAATQTVLGAAADAGCASIVHVSSVSVFQLAGAPISLDTPLRTATTGYSASKVDCEWFARGMQAAGAPVRIVYPSGVIGPDAPGLTTIHTAAQTWIRAMPMIPSGVNLVDVRDLAQIILAAADPAEGHPRRLMAGGIHTPWSELVDLIERLRGQKIRRYPAPGSVMRGIGRLVDASHLTLPVDFELTHETMTEASRAVPIDSAATNAALGVSPRPIAETLADTYRWMASVGALDLSEIGAMAALT